MACHPWREMSVGRFGTLVAEFVGENGAPRSNVERLANATELAICRAPFRLWQLRLATIGVLMDLGRRRIVDQKLSGCFFENVAREIISSRTGAGSAQRITRVLGKGSAKYGRRLDL
jgi:hypothetical protein